MATTTAKPKRRYSRNRKYFKGKCETCEAKTEFTLHQEIESEGVLEVRCNQCHGLFSFPFERVLKNGRLLTGAEFEKRQEALSKVVSYSPQKTYWRGQTIRHDTLNDVGKVIRKEKSDGDTKIIVVEFENSGKKKLVEDFRPFAS